MHGCRQENPKTAMTAMTLIYLKESPLSQLVSLNFIFL